MSNQTTTISNKTKIKSFRTWLKGFRNSNTPIGDLADDAFSDNEWKGSTVKSLKNELDRCGAMSIVYDVLEEAKEQYREYKKEITG